MMLYMSMRRSNGDVSLLLNVFLFIFLEHLSYIISILIWFFFNLLY